MAGLYRKCVPARAHNNNYSTHPRPGAHRVLSRSALSETLAVALHVNAHVTLGDRGLCREDKIREAFFEDSNSLCCAYIHRTLSPVRTAWKADTDWFLFPKSADAPTYWACSPTSLLSTLVPCCIHSPFCSNAVACPPLCCSYLFYVYKLLWTSVLC